VVIASASGNQARLKPGLGQAADLAADLAG